ncbi:unnamed protein product [Thelazia callipaeda]|uniref:Uncharacterized protein n=1 Tax=Thelazia callipaeda TaxID=103827 RepID=A0A3P7N026_THECL|nr:unnamed protein product [Thelazia callipaeda]
MISQKQIESTEPPGYWSTSFLFEQVPCAAFTDQICLQQKNENGADKMNKCCDKGVYLTDLCVPGRCTNVTVELCCMQKFLQSKYRCCKNNSKAINSPGDSFSRCCFEKFVEDEDTCCPSQRAKFHWLSSNEVCLPNVRVDLNSKTDNNKKESLLPNIITIDLSIDKSWDYTCEQGSNVLQFPYLPNNEKLNEKTEK